MRCDIAETGVRDRRDIAFERHIEITRPFGIEIGAHALDQAPIFRRSRRRWRRSNLFLGEDRLDLRVCSIVFERCRQNSGSFFRRDLGGKIHIAKWGVAHDCRFGQIKRLGEHWAHALRHQFDIGAFSRRQPLSRVTLGQVMPAMVCGEHHDIRDLALVERGKHPAQGCIKCGHLGAGFRPGRSKGVADIVSRRKADSEDIGRCAFTHFLLAKCCQCQVHGQRIKFTRSTEGARVTSLALLERSHRCIPANADSARVAGAHGRKLGWSRFIDGRLGAAVDERSALGNCGFAARIASEGFAIPPHGERGVVPTHHHCAAIFARNRNNLRRRVHRAHAIAQSRHFQQLWRNGVIAAVAPLDAGVFRTINPIIGLAILAGARAGRIEPAIGDDPGA